MQNDSNIVDPKQQSVDCLEEIEDKLKRGADTVLVVDDNIQLCRLVERNIHRADSTLKVVQAYNGLEALEQLARIRLESGQDPLLIITDLEMPVMDGWNLVKALKKDYKSRKLAQGIPVIVYSSTPGERGSFLSKQSVVDGKSGYEPLITAAKSSCTQPAKYDVTSEKGLVAWIKHFLGHSTPK
jgi:CheY-like chemotaxis protein